MTSKILSGLLLVLFLVACGGDENTDPLEDCDGALEVVIGDYEGLAGCSWLLESVAEETRFEPTNLLDFVTNPVDGEIITIGYVQKPDIFSNCQAGEIIEITCVR